MYFFACIFRILFQIFKKNDYTQQKMNIPEKYLIFCLAKKINPINKVFQQQNKTIFLLKIRILGKTVFLNPFADFFSFKKCFLIFFQ